jgi:peptide/nickel transport system permease protein
MGRYLLRRLLQALPVLLGVSVITFMLLELAPGDAVTAMIAARRMENPSASTLEDEDAMRKLYGLDAPAYVRYVKWLTNVLQGNLGKSLLPPYVPIATRIALRLGPTLELMATAILLSTIFGIIFGVFSAVKQYSWFDYVSTFLVFLGISVPAFFAGLAAVFFISLKLHWLPTSGYSTLTLDLTGLAKFLDHLRYLILPAGILAIESIASIMRYTRSSMLEVLRADYVTVARAKGLKENVVMLRHALRNALLPVLTIIGMRLPGLFGGAVIIETIFSWPGTGTLYMEGVQAHDYPLIMDMVLISAVLIVAANLITDVAYALVDPRVRFDS